MTSFFPRYKKVFFIGLIVATLLCLPLNSFSQTEEESLSFGLSEENEQQLLNLLPEELLPYFSNENGNFCLPDLIEIAKAASELFFTGLNKGNNGINKIFALIFLCSIFTALEGCLRERKKTAGVLRLFILLSGATSVFAILEEMLFLTEEHLKELSLFLGGIMPILSGIQISMGGINAASVSSLGLQMVLSLISQFSCGVLIPLLRICPVFELTAMLTENNGLSMMADQLRKLFLFLLGGLSTILLTAFAFQSVIASKADSLALRAFRYTAGQLVPLVGSVISESSKTLMAGLDLVKATVGGTAVVVILLMLLPPLVKLLLTRFSFSMLASFAKATENDLLSSLFTCGGKFIGSLAALSALSDLTVLFSFAATAAISA